MSRPKRFRDTFARFYAAEPEVLFPKVQRFPDVVNEQPHMLNKSQVYAAYIRDRANAKSVLRASKVRPRSVRPIGFDDGSLSWIPVGRGAKRKSFRSRTPSRYAGRSNYRSGGYPRRYYRGRGGYFADLLGGAAGYAGKALSGFGVGSTWGSDARKWGESQERALGKYYMGSGAYSNAGSSEPNSRFEQEVPQFETSSSVEGCTIVTHREFLRDVNSSVPFAINASSSINPGIANLFPWLSAVALNYAQYRFRSLIFTYKSTSGALSTTQALGEVIGAVQYNVNAPAFTNKQQMLSEIMSASGSPCNDKIFPVECDPSQIIDGGLLYVRGTNLPAGQSDPRLYDLGVFSLATQGQYVGNIVLGELYVSYVVELYKPQLPIVTPQSGACARFYSSVTTATNMLAGFLPSFNSGPAFISPSNNIIAFQPGTSGKFHVSIHWQCSNSIVTSTTWAPAVQGLQGAAVNMIWNNALAGSDNALSFYGTSNVGSMLALEFCVDLDGSGTNGLLSYVIFHPYAAWLPSVQACYLVITPCNQLV